MRMRRAVLADHLFVERRLADIGQARESEFLAGQRDEFLALGAADLVGGFFQTRTDGACVQAHDAKVEGALAERHVADRTVLGM